MRCLYNDPTNASPQKVGYICLCRLQTAEYYSYGAFILQAPGPTYVISDFNLYTIDNCDKINARRYLSNQILARRRY